MAIIITEDGVVNYENSPDVNRKLFPNLNICGKEIGKLEEEINGKAPAVFSTTSGSIASFDNNADDMPLKSCVVSIEPIQEGRGDPSPENVRPIIGWTGLNLWRTGKNLLDPTIHNIAPGTNLIIQDPKYRSLYTRIPCGGTYTVSRDTVSGNRFRIFGLYNEPIPGVTTMSAISNTQDDVLSKTFTVPNDIKVILIYLANDSSDITSKLQLELGSTATDYEPYKGSEISVNWESVAGTVYGGTLDVVSGKLTVDRAYIASYNGEALPSTWISDRDVYAAGATPTTGAQVVYKLADPIEYLLTAQEIRTFLGENNIWSDAGDVSVDYPADTKTYIDDLSIKTVEVTGQTPTITAEENTRYICGEVTSLVFTPCEKGICDVRFTAASISTVLTLPETVKLPEWFDPTLLESGTTYEINVLDGIYGVVMSWA